MINSPQMMMQSPQPGQQINKQQNPQFNPQMPRHHQQQMPGFNGQQPGFNGQGQYPAGPHMPPPISSPNQPSNFPPPMNGHYQNGPQPTMNQQQMPPMSGGIGMPPQSMAGPQPPMSAVPNVASPAALQQQPPASRPPMMGQSPTGMQAQMPPKMGQIPPMQGMNQSPMAGPPMQSPNQQQQQQQMPPMSAVSPNQGPPMGSGQMQSPLMSNNGMPPPPMMGAQNVGSPQMPQMPPYQNQSPNMPPMPQQSPYNNQYQSPNMPQTSPNQNYPPNSTGRNFNQPSYSQPPHPGMSQPQYPTSPMGSAPPQRRLDPDQMPNPIQVMTDNQRSNGGVFATNQPGLLPPLVTTKFVTHDQGNTNPRLLRSSMYSVPATSDMMKQSAVPFSLVISPFARLMEQEMQPPIVDMGEVGPIRCIRCKAYMSPYMQFIDAGRRFQCLLCKAVTEGTHSVKEFY